jgi:hypothetical protein
MTDLLRLLRKHTANGTHALGGLPRERVVQKQQKHRVSGIEDGAGDAFGNGAETPRNGAGEREEREFLESLRWALWLCVWDVLMSLQEPGCGADRCAATTPTTIAPTNSKDALQSVVDPLPQSDLIPTSVESRPSLTPNHP